MRAAPASLLTRLGSQPEDTEGKGEHRSGLVAREGVAAWRVGRRRKKGEEKKEKKKKGEKRKRKGEKEKGNKKKENKRKKNRKEI
jgi:hypothetical protein